MSINDAKWTFLPSFLASAITSFLVLTFVSCHASIFSSFPILSPLLPSHLVFYCLRHRNKFLHHIVVTQWIHPFSCNMIFVILVRRSFHAFPHRFIGFNNTSAFCLVFLNCATGFPDLFTLKFVRHCGWHRNFQISTRIFHDFLWIPYNQDQWKKYHAIFWRCRALVSR